MNRRMLLRGAALLLPSAVVRAVQPSPADVPARLTGRWKIAATQDGFDSKDLATLSAAQGDAMVLQIEGDALQALGGPVELRPHGGAEYRGVSRSGAEAMIRYINDQKLEFTIKGRGMHFALFLLR